MKTKSRLKHAIRESNELGLERILFFSDAVMAIAITLLAIDLKVPEIPASSAASQLPAYLSSLAPRIMSFVISFVVVGIYWASHHRYFGYIKHYDSKLLMLNLLFLFFIALMPFAASLLGQYSYLPQGVIIYAGEVAAIGLCMWSIWAYATYRHRLVDESLDPRLIRARNLVALIVPLCFILSIPIALYRPALALGSWWISPAIAALIQKFYL